MSSNLTQVILKHFLYYDPFTGIFKWVAIPKFAHRINIGDTAGTTRGKEGYVIIKLLQEYHFAHRLAWLYMTGEWPEKFIDHINVVKDDNRWKNLREADHSTNAMNVKRQTNNTSGFKGIDLDKRCNLWRVRIVKDKKEILIGYFKTKEEAVESRARAAIFYHGEFARTS